MLANTVEQALLATLAFPLVGAFVSPGLLAALGANFAIARAAYCIGYCAAPPLRAFGFVVTFYPSVLAGLWAVWEWLVILRHADSAAAAKPPRWVKLLSPPLYARRARARSAAR